MSKLSRAVTMDLTGFAPGDNVVKKTEPDCENPSYRKPGMAGTVIVVKKTGWPEMVLVSLEGFEGGHDGNGHYDATPVGRKDCWWCEPDDLELR